MMNNFILDKIKEYANVRNRVAIRFQEQELSYKELDIMSDQVALKICDALAGRTNLPILIYQKRGIEFIIFIVAVMKAKCYYVPLEDSLPYERVKYIYDDLQTELIISTQKNENLGDCNQLTVDFEEIKNDAENVLKSHELNENDLVYIMYTSGTSGKPRGVKIKYSNLCNLIKSFWRIVYHNFDECIQVGVLASFGFDASVKQIFCALYYGHTLIIAGEDIKYFGRKIHNFHNSFDITLCDCTPSHIKLMTKQPAKINSKVKYLLVGGENLRWENLIEFQNVMGIMPTIINVYGPTECCVDVAFNYISNLEGQKEGYVPIGYPLDNTELFLLDENEEIISETNVSGELNIKGKQVGAGYVNYESNSFASSYKSSREYDIYRTGDLAMYNDKKEIVILSRLDRQVKINGYRIELNEISSCIEYYLNCSCETILVETGEIKKIVAFIVGEFDELKLKSNLQKKLPAYMIPKAFMRINQIPLTKNGKMDARSLEQIYNLKCEDKRI